MRGALLTAPMLSRIKVFSALEELLLAEELDAITVRQICEVAGVGRTTFYTYFRDKYDIVLWYTGLVNETGFGQVGRTLTWKEGNLRTCKGILAKVDMLNKAGHSDDRNSINPYWKRLRINTMEETLEKYKGVKVDTNLHYQVMACAAAQTDLGLDYFNDPDRCPLEEFVDILVQVVPHDLYVLLEEPENPGEKDKQLETMELTASLVQQARF